MLQTIRVRLVSGVWATYIIVTLSVFIAESSVKVLITRQETSQVPVSMACCRMNDMPRVSG